MDGSGPEERHREMRTVVVHLVDDLNVGGLERTLAIIVKNLDKDKYRTIVWCLIGGGQIAGELERQGFEVRVLGLSASDRIRSLLRLAWRLRRERVGILHSWGISGGVWGRTASILARVPVRFVHVQNTYYDLDKSERFKERFLGIFTDRIIACSEAVKKCLVESVGVNVHKVETIRNSVETEKFRKIRDIQSVRAEFDPGSKDIIVGSVSRLVPVKGYHYLLAAAVKILRKFPNVKFLVVGDGALRKNIESASVAEGIKKNFIFTGYREDIPRLLSIMDIFVHPSGIREGLPLAIAEAMACGIPVVAGDIGGTSEIVKDGETGLLTPPGNVHALAGSIISLIENPGMAREMGKKGREFVEEKFSSRLMVKKTEDLYDRLIREKIEKSQI